MFCFKQLYFNLMECGAVVFESVNLKLQAGLADLLHFKTFEWC